MMCSNSSWFRRIIPSRMCFSFKLDILHTVKMSSGERNLLWVRIFDFLRETRHFDLVLVLLVSQAGRLRLYCQPHIMTIDKFIDLVSRRLRLRLKIRNIFSLLELLGCSLIQIEKVVSLGLLCLHLSNFDSVLVLQARPTLITIGRGRFCFEEVFNVLFE
jgi:hypothetical protein